MLERNERKVVFDQIAEEYDAIRPGYPEEFIDNVVKVAAVPEGGRILEVGCGSGQATESLLRYGAEFTCLDISPSLLSIAEKKFGGRADIDIRFRQSSFEEFDGEGKPFDLVIAASSWHWIDPEIGYRKAASLLAPTGSLAVIATLHPKPFTGFFERVQEVYRDVVPEWGNPNSTRTTADVIRDTRKEMESSGCFRTVTSVRCEWSIEYRRDDYLRLLKTYSDHYRLGPERLGLLFEGIGRLIDESYGGRVTRPYETVGYVGRK